MHPDHVAVNGARAVRRDIIYDVTDVPSGQALELLDRMRYASYEFWVSLGSEYGSWSEGEAIEDYFPSEDETDTESEMVVEAARLRKRLIDLMPSYEDTSGCRCAWRIVSLIHASSSQALTAHAVVVAQVHGVQFR